ncbi:ribonuclease H, partial [Trifolium pratense]
RVLRNGKVVNYHVYSSLWSSIKQEATTILENSCWKVGSGCSIDLWTDSWCGNALAETLNIHPNVLIWLPQKQVVLPFEPLPDVLVWSGNDKGLLTLKDAYNFKRNHFPVLSWAKVIWCIDVPPSRSLLVWRIMLDKLPTDDKCEFAFGLWRWLATSLNLVLQFQSMEDIWNLCDKARSNWKSSMTWIAANVVLAGNHTKALSSGTINDFSMLKAFMVTVHPPKPMSLKEVIWQPPPPQWIKCNTDGALTPSASACGGIFRNSNAEFLCAFASKTDMASAFSAELCGFMTAIEIADARGWRNMLIESDSMLVVNAYKSSNLVSWSLSNRWFNCLKLAGHMNIIVSHIFREGNHCADRLANIGLNLDRLTLWNDVPFVVKDSFESNRLGKPFYKVVHS